MNKNLVTAMLALATLSSTACTGVKTRTAAEWQAELQQDFAAREYNLRACYAASGLTTKVELAIRIEADKYQDRNGGANTVTVESVGAGNSAAKLVGCVKDVASTIVVRPEDKKNAYGLWVLKFDTDVDGSAAAPADGVPKA